MTLHTSLKLARTTLTAIGWRSTLEQEQAVLRISISTIFMAYLLATRPGEFHPHPEPWLFAFYYVEFFLIYALTVLISTLYSPTVSVIRRLLTIVADIGLFSYGLYESGSIGAPWYGVYLWITLGNGFRYGEKYLYVSGAASLLGFISVAMLTPYWITHQSLAIGLAITLLVIPIYAAWLIRRLNEARYQADTANQAKSRFLSRMSHEIRTPLNGVLGMTELLKNLPLDKQAQHYVHIIATSGQALNHQIDEILDLSKIEAEQLPIEQIEFDLHVLINQTLQMFDAQAAQQDTKLCEYVDPQAPYLLKGDPYRLQQIIINLVSNAIKFTHQGTVTLRVLLIRLDATQAVICFEIIDTGIGMEQDAVSKIFEPFHQADASITRKFGGTGLGTTICKALVELMHGKIGLHSSPGSGTTFWFELPFHFSKNLLNEQEDWRKHCRTLYISNPAQQEDPVSDLLKQWHIPFQQINIRDAVSKLVQDTDKDDEWHAIIVDLRFYKALKSLLNDCDACQHRTVITVSNKAEALTETDISKLDHATCLINAIKHPHQLSNALHASYIKYGNENIQITLTEKQHKEGSKDWKALKILVSDDNPVNRLIVEQMLKQAGHLCDIVEGGKAALEALRDQPYDAVLIDKNMPDMGGIEVLKAYRLTHSGSNYIPFILLTADATEESQIQAKAAGINYFLAKPLSAARLAETLVDISCHNGAALQKTSLMKLKSVVVDTPNSTPECVFDSDAFKALISISEDSRQFAGELIVNFKRDALRNVTSMEDAVHNENLTGFKDVAHALKGSASYVGLIGLEKICKKSEHIDTDVFRKNSLAVLNQIRNEVTTGIKALEAQQLDDRQVG